jgi:hypothetical protein
LKGSRRELVPLNSAVVVADPLPQSMWDDLGWDDCQLLGDASHAYCYAQRTRGGRIAMGGRGVPYRFGSGTDVKGQTQPETINQLKGILERLLPQTRDVGLHQAWCGVLGVPRDWCASAGMDHKTGIATAGGYVGVGVSTSNFSGQTLFGARNGANVIALGQPKSPRLGTGATKMAGYSFNVLALSPCRSKRSEKQQHADVNACAVGKQNYRTLINAPLQADAELMVVSHFSFTRLKIVKIWL